MPYDIRVGINYKKVVSDWADDFVTYDGRHSCSPGYAAPNKKNCHPDYWGFRKIIIGSFSFKKNRTNGKIDIDKVYTNYQEKVAARFRRYDLHYTAKRRVAAKKVFNGMVDYILI